MPPCPPKGGVDSDKYVYYIVYDVFSFYLS